MSRRNPLQFGVANSGAPAIDTNSELVALIPALRAFARTFCRNSTDADDLVQETLLRAIANIDKYTPGTRMKSWLFTIMRNAFYTRAKRAAREVPGEMDCASSRPVTEAQQEWSVRGKEMQAALDELPQQQREVVILIGVLGFSYEDSAKICGCAVGTVKSRLNRARIKLYEYFGEDTPEEIMEPTTRHFVNTLPELRHA